ncbi:hypothetical protein [Streptomyces griseoviridis]|uniref:hypothetical protein n=1 Tax=Streptomyces griseoviridis TaxID=45398 RepID=UPI003451415E
MNDVLYGLAANPALPAEVADRLIDGADADLADRLAQRPDLSRAQTAALASRWEDAAVRLARRSLLTTADPDPMTRPRLTLALLERDTGYAEGPRSPDDADRPERPRLPGDADRRSWARLLAGSPSVEHRERLAACPGLPPDVVRRLATDPATAVVAELAVWTCSPELLAGLAAHPHTDVRRSVAANEATPPATLAALLAGGPQPPARSCPFCDGTEVFLPDTECDGRHRTAERHIHEQALRNPATPADVAARFAGNPCALLRRHLASRPDLPRPAYELLARDPDPRVRADLADNPGIDARLIRSLAADPDPEVLGRLARHPCLPLDLLPRLAGLRGLGRSPLPCLDSATRPEITALAASAHPGVRMVVARRRDLPDDVRDALARDPDAKVVNAVAPHPGLGEGQLTAMVERHGVRVVVKVAENPGASPALLLSLAAHRPPVPKVLRVIARHPHATAPVLLACLTDLDGRRVAAARAGLPVSALVELLADGDASVREAAAANPVLPVAVMRQLVAV